MSFPGLDVVSGAVRAARGAEPSLLAPISAFSNAVLLWQAGRGVANDRSSWASLIGTVTASQADAGKRPALGQINGRTALIWDGVNDYMQSADTVTVGTIFVVARFDDPTFPNFTGLLTGNLGITGYPFRGASGGTQWRTAEDSTSGANRFLDGADTDEAAPGALHVYELTYASPQAKNFTIGEDFAALGTGRSWKGPIACIVGFSDTKNSTDRDSIRAILRAHYGLAGAMSGHAQLSLSASGTLVGIAPISGNATLTISASATLGTAGPVLVDVSPLAEKDPTFGLITLTAGITPQPGDILIAHLEHVGTTNGFTPPAGEGWALIGTRTHSATHNHHHAAYWKRVGSGSTDDASPTFGVNDNQSARGVLQIWRGCVAAGNPYDNVAVASGDDGPTMTAPDVVSGGAGRVSLRLYASTGDNEHFNPSEGTLAYGGAAYSVITGNDGALSCSYLTGETSGPVGTATMQWGVTTLGDWSAISVALR